MFHSEESSHTNDLLIYLSQSGFDFYYKIYKKKELLSVDESIYSWSPRIDDGNSETEICESFLLKTLKFLTDKCVLFVRSGDLPVRGLVQPPPGPAEPPQQGHQERGQDRTQLISLLCSLNISHKERTYKESKITEQQYQL